MWNNTGLLMGYQNGGEVRRPTTRRGLQMARLGRQAGASRNFAKDLEAAAGSLEDYQKYMQRGEQLGSLVGGLFGTVTGNPLLGSLGKALGTYGGGKLGQGMADDVEIHNTTGMNQSMFDELHSIKSQQDTGLFGRSAAVGFSDLLSQFAQGNVSLPTSSQSDLGDGLPNNYYYPTGGAPKDWSSISQESSPEVFQASEPTLANQTAWGQRDAQGNRVGGINPSLLGLFDRFKSGFGV